jgi:hypothetical protein
MNFLGILRSSLLATADRAAGAGKTRRAYGFIGLTATGAATSEMRAIFGGLFSLGIAALPGCHRLLHAHIGYRCRTPVLHLFRPLLDQSNWISWQLSCLWHYPRSVKPVHCQQSTKIWMVWVGEMMAFVQNYLFLAGLVLGLMFVLWLLSLVINNSSIVDIFWGTGFIIFAWAAFLLTPDGFLPRKLLLCCLVSIWGLRLSLHILLRNWGRPEDFRYQKWRQDSGASWWWRSLFRCSSCRDPSSDNRTVAGCPDAASADHLTWLDGLAVIYGW